MSLAVRCLALSFFILACGRDLTQISQPAAIVGSNEQVAVGDPSQLPESIQGKLAAIGRLDGLCTAFHLGEGLVATAAHCFAEAAHETDPCVSNDVEWSDGQRSQCVQILYKSYNGDNDMLIFEVDPAPAARFEVVDQSDSQSFEALDLMLLGYPHESALSLSSDCSVQQLAHDSRRFEHDCDSLPGNSGSPVLARDSGLVVGIHNGSSEPLNYGTLLHDWEEVQVEVQRIRRGRIFSQSTQNRFGPFQNNQKVLLRHLSSDAGEYVRFDMAFDIEDGYDFVVIRDGFGVRRTLTGNDQTSLDLKTPVVVMFESDYAGASEMVSFDAVFYHN